MPNVVLKDEHGDPIVYNDVLTISVPTDDGASAAFNYGMPKKTMTCEEFDYYLTQGSNNPITPSTYTSSHGYKIIYNTSVRNFGLWVVTPFEAFQIWDDGYNYWSSFNQAEHGVFITSGNNSSQGILYYDEVEMACTKIYSNGYSQSQFITCDDGYIIKLSSFVVYVDKESIEVTPLILNNVGYYTIVKIDGNIMFLCTNSTESYMYFFDEETIQLIPNDSATCRYMNTTLRPIKEGYYLCTASTNGSYGYIIDVVNHTTTKLQDYINYYAYSTQFDDFYLIYSWSSGANYTGLLYLDRNNLEVTKLTSDGYLYSSNDQYSAIFGDKIFLYSRSNTTGFFYIDLYDMSAQWFRSGIDYDSGDTVTLGNYIYTIRNYKQDHYIMFDGTSYQFWIFDASQGELYRKYKSGAPYIGSNSYVMDIFYDSANHLLLYWYVNGVSSSSSSYPGICSFNEDDYSVTPMINSGSYFPYTIIINGILFFCTTYTRTYNLLKYNPSVGEIETIPDITNVSNFVFNNSYQVSGGYIFYYQNGSTYLIFYNPDNDTFTEIKDTDSTRRQITTYDIIDMNDRLFFTGSGVWSYDKEHITISIKSSGGSYLKKYIDVPGGFILACGINSTPYGSKIYRTSTDEFLTSNMYINTDRSDYAVVDGGLLFYNKTQNTSNSGTDYQGIWYYDNFYMTATKVYNYGYGWSEIEPTGTGYYIQAYNMPFYKKLYFDSDSKTITEV